MAFSLNQLILVGNLTADADLRYTPNGTAVCTFTVATNRRWRDDKGEWQEAAEFTRCVAWREAGERAAKILGKGSSVYVNGRIQTRKWQDKDGRDRYSTECVVNSFGLLIDRANKLAGLSGATSSSPEPSESSEPVESPEPSDAETAELQDKEPTSEVQKEDIPF